MLRRAGFRAALLATCLASPWAPAGAATLTEALAASYNSNPQILAERARLRVTDEQVPQALSGWRPVVTLTGQAGVSQSNTYGPPSTANGQFGTTPHSVDLNVSQPVYQGGRTIAATSRAENLVRAERARNYATEQVVFSSVILAYMDVLQNQAVLELSINNEHVLQRQLEASNDRFRVGEITRTDVAQSESRLAQAISDRQAAEGNLQTSRATYERQVGEPPGQLTAPSERAVLPATKEEAVRLASQTHPNVVSAQYTEAAARDAVAQTRGELLPDVRIVGDVSHADDSGIAQRSNDNYSLIARVVVPLYESGSVYSRTREAKQTVSQRRGELDDARRQVVEAASRAWENVVSGRARVDSFRTQIKAAEIALEGVQQEALVGSRTVLDVLNAEQELFTARVNLVRAQHDEIVAEFDLTAAIGRLTAVDLRLPVQLYDVNQNYNDVREKWTGVGIKGDSAR